MTLVAIRDRRAALLGSAAATVGALAGGLLMYLWGSADPAGSAAALLSVPAIGDGMITQVGESLGSQGFLALLLGPLRGIPYKIYAVESGRRHLGLAPFLLVSVPARALRFVILSLAASWASRRPLASWPLPQRRLVAIVLWAVFYALYFATKR